MGGGSKTEGVEQLHIDSESEEEGTTQEQSSKGKDKLPTTEQGAKNKANDGKGKKRKLGGGSKTAGVKQPQINKQTGPGVRRRDREQSYSPCHSPPPKRPTRSNLHLPGWSRQMGGTLLSN